MNYDTSHQMSLSREVGQSGKRIRYDLQDWGRRHYQSWLQMARRAQDGVSSSPLRWSLLNRDRSGFAGAGIQCPPYVADLAHVAGCITSGEVSQSGSDHLVSTDVAQDIAQGLAKDAATDAVRVRGFD